MSALPIGRPRFVTIEETLAWHNMGLLQFGGSSGVRDLGLLESALAQPRQGFSGQYAHEFPFEMAAAYAYHIAKNHPFVDGNKRAALLCCSAFLRMNGWNLVSVGELAADAVVGLVEGKLTKQSFALWLAQHCRPRPSFELRDFFRELSFKQLREHVLSSGGGAQRRDERYATLEEAAIAMPCIAELLNAAARAHAPGDSPSALALHAHLLVCLYRIAEDMGYEW